jgi:hypothetical protein
MRRTILFLAVMFAVAAFAQAPHPFLIESVTGEIPAEPGMYVQTKNGLTKILGQIVTFKRSGSLFVSTVTVGIKAKKENVQLLGAHAQTQVDGKAVFYFIPAKQEAEAGINAGDLVLIRLEEKTKRRQFEIGAQGAWRASTGISITHQIQLSRSEIKPGIYTLAPAVEIGKGEYALYLIRGEGTQAYIYDFAVSSKCCELSRQPDATDTASAIQSRTNPHGGRTAVNEAEANQVGRSQNLETQASNTSNDQAIAEISSDPPGAEIEIDGNFVGDTPSSVGLAAGEHTLMILKNGYASWERTLRSSSGTIKIVASLIAETPGSAVNAVSRSTVSPNRLADESRIGLSFTGNPLAKHDGLEVSDVQPHGPADNIDIKPGDIIIALDGHYLYTIDGLRTELRGYKPGAKLAIRYRRGRLTYDNYLVLASQGTTSLR